MNDLEFANLNAREQNARKHGISTNAYTCGDCVTEGRSWNDSTYTDWPDIVDGVEKCSRHAGSAGTTPLTHSDLRVIEASRAVALLTDEERLDLVEENRQLRNEVKDLRAACQHYTERAKKAAEILLGERQLG